MSNLTTRVIVAAVGIPLLIAIVVAGGWFFAAFIALVSALGALEVVQLGLRKSIRAHAVIAVPCAAAIPLLIALKQPEAAMALVAVAVGGALLLQLRAGIDGALSAVGTTLVAAFYPAALLCWLIPLRQLAGSAAEGRWLVLLLLSSIWVCDTAAYFVGLRRGRHPLAPRISPKKTWEGAIAGFAAAVVWWTLWLPVLVAGSSWWLGTMLGAAVGTIGQVGDVAESLLKRDAQVKDSSALIPGHGGVLDRFDSLSAAAPAVYALVELARRSDILALGMR